MSYWTTFCSAMKRLLRSNSSGFSLSSFLVLVVPNTFCVLSLCFMAIAALLISCLNCSFSFCFYISNPSLICLKHFIHLLKLVPVVAAKLIESFLSEVGAKHMTNSLPLISAFLTSVMDKSCVRIMTCRGLLYFYP